MIRFSNRFSGSQSVAVPPHTIASSSEMLSVNVPMSSPYQSSMGSPPMGNQNVGSPFYDDASVS